MTYLLFPAVVKAAGRHLVDPEAVDWHLEADHGWEPHDRGYVGMAEIAARCVAGKRECSLLEKT